MLKKDADGRIKRIEYRGRHLRASRTGGVALRAQTKMAGINLTANTASGLRISTRVAKGTQVGFQNGRFVLRGRYGSGPTKLNLSKSGISVSSKTDIGTINWFRPRYSSAKIGGIQVRGKNAVYLHLIVGIFQIVAYLLLFLAQIIVLLIQGLFWLILQIYRIACSLISLLRDRSLRPVEDRWLAEIKNWELTQLKDALEYIFLKLATGHALEPTQINSHHCTCIRLANLIDGCALKPPRDLEFLFACLTDKYADQTSQSECLDYLLELDERSVASGGRNLLQERLLGAGLNACGVECETEG